MNFLFVGNIKAGVRFYSGTSYKDAFEFSDFFTQENCYFYFFDGNWARWKEIIQISAIIFLFDIHFIQFNYRKKEVITFAMDE